MNKFFNYLLLFVIFFSSCSPTPKQASQYNNKLIRQQRNVVDKMDNLIASFSTYDKDQINLAYSDLISTINSALGTVQNIGAFDGSTEFRDKTIELLKLYKDVTENEFNIVKDLLSKPQQEFSQQDANTVSDKMLEARDKVTKANQEYKNYQQEFAKKYNLAIIE